MKPSELLSRAAARTSVAVEIGGGCNNRCVFCRARLETYETDTARLIARIGESARDGCTEIVLTGHEPTIHCDFLKILSAASGAGYRIVRVETNGRMFSYPEFCRRAAEAGMTHADVLLTGGDEPTSLRVNPVPDAFAQTVRGVRTLRAEAPAVHLSINIPVTRDNVDALAETVALARKLGAKRVCLVPVDTVSEGEMAALTPGIRNVVERTLREGFFIEVRGGGETFSPEMRDMRVDREDDDFHVTTYATVGRGRRREGFSEDIRVTYRCNQNCVFCGVDKKQHIALDERVVERIREAARARIPRLVLGGGEPTLCPELESWIRLAKEGGIHDVTLMTNAVRLAEPGAARALRAVGLDRAFVSLHAHESALSDALTRTPGTFDLTVRGTRNCLEAGIRTGLIFVICSENMHVLPDYIDFAARTFGDVPVFCSFVSPYYDPTLPAGIVPRYTDAMPWIQRAAETAAARGILFSCMEEQHIVPECILPEPRSLFRNLFAPIDRSLREDFARAAACERCSAAERCPGMKKFYARIHGTGELHSI